MFGTDNCDFGESGKSGVHCTVSLNIGKLSNPEESIKIQLLTSTTKPIIPFQPLPEIEPAQEYADIIYETPFELPSAYPVCPEIKVLCLSSKIPEKYDPKIHDQSLSAPLSIYRRSAS